MKTIVYCADPEDQAYEKSVAKLAGDGVEIVLMPISAAKKSSRKKTPSSIIYFDADAASAEEIATLGQKASERGPWGVLDRAGRVVDPALIFQAGASDYLGPPLVKKGRPLSAARAETAFAFHNRVRTGISCSEGEKDAKTGKTTDRPLFPGWDKLKPETCYPFIFFYASIANQSDITVRLGEKRIDKLRGDFSTFMGTWAEERGGKLWIRDATSNLILFPVPDGKNVTENPLLSAFRLLMDRILISYENFRLTIPVSFNFALHIGFAPWRRPGSTGTVVSEHVNFIYHLGTKAVPDGTLGISEQAKELIESTMVDLFIEGKPFEGHRVWYSRKIR